MLSYYITDERSKGGLEITHFCCLTDAIAAYKSLPASRRKALGFQVGGAAADLARCIPILHGDREGEDVIALGFLSCALGEAREEVISAAQELTESLRVRYCLYRNCLLPIPTEEVLPKWLRDRYLWPTVPGKYETSIQWLKVVSVGNLSLEEFKRRYRTDDDSADHFPLVKRSKERFQNKKHQGGTRR